jgi:hypothetical protein
VMGKMDLAQWVSAFKALHDRAKRGALDNT